MRRKELQDIIDSEFDNFIEFPDERIEAVTVASCKLFAEHVVGVIQARPAVQRDVAGLVEALELARDRIESERRSGEWDPLLRDIDAALAAHRKQGTE